MRILTEPQADKILGNCLLIEKCLGKQTVSNAKTILRAIEEIRTAIIEAEKIQIQLHH